jgi:hypothetical protein
MRKTMIFLLIILLCSFSFATLEPLIKYSEDNATSHACIPSSGNCAYATSILIEDTYLADSFGIKILGLSDDPTFPGTNAHVETTNTLGGSVVSVNNNYNINGVYLTQEGIDKCNFEKGTSCSSGNCIFGMSDESNAHLSRCNTFGTEEIKLCCEFDVFFVNHPGPTPPDNCEINIFEAEDVFVNDPVDISYSCVSTVDANINVFDAKGNPVLPSIFETTCGLVEQKFDGYTFTNIQQIAIVTISTNKCVKEKIFAVKSKVESAIPDSNLFLVIFVVLVVSIILVKKKD